MGGSQPSSPQGGIHSHKCLRLFVNQPSLPSSWGTFCSSVQPPPQQGWVHPRAGLGWGMLSHGEGQSTPWHPTACLGTGMGTSPGWMENFIQAQWPPAAEGLLWMGLGGTGITAGWPRSPGRAASDRHGNTPHLVLKTRAVFWAFSLFSQARRTEVCPGAPSGQAAWGPVLVGGLQAARALLAPASPEAHQGKGILGALGSATARDRSQRWVSRAERGGGGSREAAAAGGAGECGGALLKTGDLAGTSGRAGPAASLMLNPAPLMLNPAPPASHCQHPPCIPVPASSSPASPSIPVPFLFPASQLPPARIPPRTPLRPHPVD